MKIYNSQKIILVLLMFLIVACGRKPSPNDHQSVIPTNIVTPESVTPNNDEFQVIISRGYETDPQDNGRPVVLIASMLGVSTEVFREAFSNVHPAGTGTGGPTEQQAQANKAALMSVLEPYGVTNDYLDEVSNYYRYNRSAGETWPQIPAEVEAIVQDGVVTGFNIINPGSGYTSAPTITVTGTDVSATATLAFTTDFTTNGSISEIILNP